MNNEDYISLSNLKNYSNINKLQDKLNALSSKSLEKDYKKVVNSPLFNYDYLNNISNNIKKLLNSNDDYLYDKLYNDKLKYQEKYEYIKKLKNQLNQENIYDFYKKFSTKNNNLNINNVITIKDFNIDQLKSTREAIINSIFSDIMRSLRKIRNKNSNKDKELKEFLFKNNKPNLFSLRKYDNQKEFETLNFYINGIIDFRYLSFQLPLIYNHQNFDNH